jgi:uncharacterized protein
MKELVEYIAKALVENPDAVSVTEVTKRSIIIIELHVAPEDMGRVIGKEGRIANAIRALLRTTGGQTDRRISLEIM